MPLMTVFWFSAIQSADETVRAEPKIALLIANGKYQHCSQLQSPIPDMELLSNSLKRMGFSVQTLRDASKEQMLDSLSEFERRLRANRGIAFFHYGGHGVQVGGRNYLLPVDANIPDESRVATRAVDAEEVVAAMEQSDARVSVVILDACRDNPLPKTSTRSATRGLAPFARKPKNSVIVFSAEAGNKAQDGLFTPTLVKHLETPGQSLSQTLMRVRREVVTVTNHSQTPGEYNQLLDEVYLFGGATAVGASGDLSARAQVPQQKVVGNPVEALGMVPEPARIAPPAFGRDVSDMETVIRDYYRAVVARDEAVVQNSFAEKVNYLSYGTLPRAKVLADHRGDWKRYSKSQFEVSNFVSTSAVSCRFIVDYSLMQGDRPRFGRLEMKATLTAAAPQKITTLEAKVISAR